MRREKKMGSKPSGGVAGAVLSKLPGDCLAKILSLTTTKEACNLSCVSKAVRSAADSDLVWEMFLPSDYPEIINRSINPSSILSLPSKKQIYRRLCDRPLLIDGGRKTFTLEKRNGMKSYMLSAKDLEIAWGHEPLYWKWATSSGSRFEAVAMLIFIWRLEIRGLISTWMLSLDTTYAAYLVFAIMEESIGLNDKKMEASFGILGDDLESRFVHLTPARKKVYGIQYPAVRADGWLEIELGEFVNEGGAERKLEMSLKEIKSQKMKKGLIVEGIEIRPKRKGL